MYRAYKNVKEWFSFSAPPLLSW